MFITWYQGLDSKMVDNMMKLVTREAGVQRWLSKLLTRENHEWLALSLLLKKPLPICCAPPFEHLQTYQANHPMCTCIFWLPQTPPNLAPLESIPGGSWALMSAFCYVLILSRQVSIWTRSWCLIRWLCANRGYWFYNFIQSERDWIDTSSGSLGGFRACLSGQRRRMDKIYAI